MGGSTDDVDCECSGGDDGGSGCHVDVIPYMYNLPSLVTMYKKHADVFTK